MRSYFSTKISLLLVFILFMQPLYGMQASLFNRFAQAISRYGSMPMQDIKALYTWGMKKRLGKPLTQQEKLAAVQAGKHARNIGITAGTVMAIIASIIAGIFIRKKVISHLEDKKKTTQNNNNIALVEAARDGKLEEVKKLLAKGADINTVHEYLTPLMAAADQGNAQIVEELLQSGANVNSTNWYGNTALINAARKDNSKIVKMLLNSGANVDQKNSAGNTALFEAVSALSGSISSKYPTETIKILAAKGANLNTFGDENTWTPLMTAVSSPAVDLVKWLLQNGAKVNIATKDTKETALHFAARKGHENYPDRKDRVRLYYAVIVDLLKHRANLEAQDRDKKTPRDYMEKNPILKRLLPESKVQLLDIAVQQDPKKTPLAILYKDVIGVIKGFIKEDPSIPDPKYVLNLPLKHVEVVEKYPLIAALKAGNLTKVKDLLSNPEININQQDENGDTALIIAARNQLVEIAKLLVKVPGIIIQHHSENTALQAKDRMVFNFMLQNFDAFKDTLREYNRMRQEAQKNQRMRDAAKRQRGE